MTCFIFQAKGCLLLPLTLVPSLAGLVMHLTIANFLSTLLLGRCPIILPPTMDLCVGSSAFPAQPIACCGSTIPFATSYKNPTGKNKSGSKISKQCCHESFAIFHLGFTPMLPLQALDKGPFSWACLLFIHSSMQSFNELLATIFYMDAVIFEDRDKVQPLLSKGSLSKGKNTHKLTA